MTTPEAVFISYRLGGNDGVAVEAAKWEWALREIGFTCRRIAGEIGDAFRPDDTWLAFLAIDPVAGAEPEPGALAAGIAGADLVIVENLCSLPLNPEAARITAEVLTAHRGRIVFHHHDFAWERPHLEHITGFPPTVPGAVHVTISEFARRSLEQRGIEAHAIPNSFDFDQPTGAREHTRTAIGAAPEEVVLLQPTRAIPRKNVPGGIGLARRVRDLLHPRPVRYWITGPAEDGYDEEFAALVAAADLPVHVGRAGRVADAYAAADIVVFPSTWEGFGNPVIEAVAARRMAAIADYPVLRETTAGLDLLRVEDADAVARWCRDPDPTALEANRITARDRFSIELLPGRIASLFETVGWAGW